MIKTELIIEALKHCPEEIENGSHLLECLRERFQDRTVDNFSELVHKVMGTVWDVCYPTDTKITIQGYTIEVVIESGTKVNISSMGSFLAKGEIEDFNGNPIKLDVLVENSPQGLWIKYLPAEL